MTKKHFILIAEVFRKTRLYDVPGLINGWKLTRDDCLAPSSTEWQWKLTRDEMVNTLANTYPFFNSRKFIEYTERENT